MNGQLVVQGAQVKLNADARAAFLAVFEVLTAMRAAGFTYVGVGR